MRWLFLVHRYLGIVLGLVMALWCASGVVMMYVSYPALAPAARLRGLALVDWRHCCSINEDALADGDGVNRFEVEMLAGHPVVRVSVADSPGRTIDLTDGKPIGPISIEQARRAAASFGQVNRIGTQPQYVGPLDYDQWTVSGEFRAHRPLLLFDFHDDAGTQLYVSGKTGELVQMTTARLRFWNWLGAVPHWIYFSSLRRNARLWTRIVVYTSLVGSFLVVTGIYIGVWQFLRRPAGRWSPYRRVLFWHHVPGLLFGVFALTWVVSGLLSMNPWGLLENGGAEIERARLLGAGITGAQVKQSLRALPVAAPAEVVSIESAPLHGQLNLIASTASAARWRLDAQGMKAPLVAADFASAAKLLAGGAAFTGPELLNAEDNYYFSHHLDTVSLPVYRVIVADAQHTRYYLDPVSGELIGSIDGNGRAYRWLHQGLHRLDFTPALRARPTWDVIMLLLLCGVGASGFTGAYLGIRRLLGRGPPRST
jgi:hypothetical protein